MANGFGTLYIGQSGLQSAQNALNTTANNLANVDTKGYVREQVIFADENYRKIKDVTTRTNMQQSGLGVSIGDVVHIRDIFLDKAFRQETGRASYYNTSCEVTDQIQDFLQELDGKEFKDSLEELWQAFQEYEKEPENTTNQNLVVEKTELFLNRCDSVYKDLQSYQENLNDQVADSVTKINEMAKDIYKYNLEIQKVESGKVETAMAIRDARDALIDDLSTYGKVEVEEDATGFAYIKFENIDLIGADRAYTIELRKDDTTGFYTPYWKHLSNIPADRYQDVFNLDAVISPEFNSDIGSVKALLLARGNEYGINDHLINEDIITQDDIDNDLLKRYKQEDLGKEKHPYSDLKRSAIMEVQAEISHLLRKIVVTVNDNMSPLKESGLQTITGTAEDGSTVTFTMANDGSFSYKNDTTGEEHKFTSNESLLGKVKQVKDASGNIVEEVDFYDKEFRKPASLLILDEENSSYGSDKTLPPRELFERYGCERYTKVTTDSGKVYYVYNGERADNPSTQYNLSRVKLNEDIKNQAALMPTYRKDGAVDRRLSENLANAWDIKDMTIGEDDTTPCNINGFFDKLVVRVGNRGSTYQKAGETLTNSSAALDKKRQETIGVSSDEELTKLIKYQSAYNASSRFITVISEMTELIVSGLK
ncbi:flagellar hook-associated protein 1 FlgK [Lachnospiraceae bacterium C7]|nr:flagellar hook-associated protein 1 FlgK [Lachnospiraceae bacterium C7]